MLSKPNLLLTNARLGSDKYYFQTHYIDWIGVRPHDITAREVSQRSYQISQIAQIATFKIIETISSDFQ